MLASYFFLEELHKNQSCNPPGLKTLGSESKTLGFDFIYVQLGIYT